MVVSRAPEGKVKVTPRETSSPEGRIATTPFSQLLSIYSTIRHMFIEVHYILQQ
jgi:hypothetical protein